MTCNQDLIESMWTIVYDNRRFEDEIAAICKKYKVTKDFHVDLNHATVAAIELMWENVYQALMQSNCDFDYVNSELVHYMIDSRINTVGICFDKLVYTYVIAEIADMEGKKSLEIEPYRSVDGEDFRVRLKWR